MESNKKATVSELAQQARLKQQYDERLSKLFAESGDFAGRQDGLTNVIRALTTVLENYVLTE